MKTITHREMRNNSAEVLRGNARAARSGVETLLEIRLAETVMSTAEILHDSRGRW